MRYNRICILGGTGFVGHHLAARLVARGYALRLPSRHPELRPEVRVLPRTEILQANVHNPVTLEKLFTGVDTVINLVGILNEPGRDGSGFRLAHVELVEKLIEACRKTDVRRVLHMSALNADARNGPSHYLRTKGEGERLLQAAEDLDVTRFRPSVIYGPDDSFLNRFVGLLRLAPVFPLACPDSRFAPVYVQDVCSAFETALADDASIGKVYELCGPGSYRLRELVRMIARQLGLRRVIIGLPDVLSRLQARVLEHLPGKPFSLDNYRSLQVDSVCSNNGLPQLGIEPVHLESMLGYCLGQRAGHDRLDSYRRRARRTA